ncbi:MAG: methyltransferase domain-containing protein [Gluconacetobacter diazotrophicus]|nr:methyltransferase domain-containing protein [Gluconacetobacter diazotrophicus]
MTNTATPALLSPTSGRPLHPDTPHSLADGAGERWPVVDGIPFLRAGREALAAAALARLDAGDPDGALTLLLADQDDWWTGPVAAPDAIRRLLAGRATLSLREAMALLSWGRVGDYFAHRWSDPTFMAGLSLAAAHWCAPRTGFELACGIGHHLRALAQRGVRVSGADVVFGKLWIARHFVCPDAELLCFDAASPWPLPPDRRFDLVCCHDAFYFLEPKAEILQRLRALAADGTLLVGHVHNRDWPNLSAGAAIDADTLGALFPDGTFYDDHELTRAAAELRAPVPAPLAALREVEAFAVAAGRPGAPRFELTLPPVDAALRRNPLYGDDGALAWPSERYRIEYSPRATYPARTDVPAAACLDAATRPAAAARELVDLPERW